MRPKSKILIIAGSDSSGGAGIQADIKTVTALGGYAMTAITALTAQNTTGVNSVIPINAEEVKKQMEEILYDLGYSKCGEEPSTLSDKVPIVIFERKKKVGKLKVKNFNKKTIKKKNYKDKKLSIKQNKEKLPDPLSPFAVLKSIKIK